jgi:hypothetical protein
MWQLSVRFNLPDNEQLLCLWKFSLHPTGRNHCSRSLLSSTPGFVSIYFENSLALYRVMTNDRSGSTPALLLRPAR